jgi:hypothetical protein
MRLTFNKNPENFEVGNTGDGAKRMAKFMSTVLGKDGPVVGQYLDDNSRLATIHRRVDRKIYVKDNRTKIEMSWEAVSKDDFDQEA